MKKTYGNLNSELISGTKRLMKRVQYIFNMPRTLLFSMCISVTIFVGCKKFVTVDAPKNKLISETVFSTNETANAAMLNVYFQMVYSQFLASPYFIALYGGLSGDELKSYSSGPGIRSIYLNSINPLEARTNDIWEADFNNLYRVNAVIEGCQESTLLSPLVKKQLIAEAMLVRAFLLFNLVNSFGDIPLVISTDYTVNSKLSRTDKKLVYKQIVDDLLSAERNLASEYVGLDGVTPSGERVRPNRAAASSLLSRVYLYMENYTGAEDEASKVINQQSIYDLVPLESVFLKNNKEAIWQLMTPVPNYNVVTSEGQGFILTSKPDIGTGTTGLSTISQSLLNAFELNDQRKINWIGKYTDISVSPNIDYFYPNKYKIKVGTEDSEYSTVFRLAEQYLIRAEARAKQENLAGAIDDLDMIRKRASLGLIKEINPNIAKEDLLNLILKERRVELFTEWGHRWYDLKRTGKINEVMTNAAMEKGSTWNTNKQLWPIPPLDIQNNPNLKPQNPGYTQ